MTTYVTPKVNTQYIFYGSLVSQADTKLLKSNPTIAAGDFKVSTDGGALANLGTLPTVTPASSVMVKYTLSTSEMNGANVSVVSIDAAGAEWCDAFNNLQTSTRQIDDLAFPATSGRSMATDANGVSDARLADAVAHGGTLGSSTATLALSRASVVSQSANTAALTLTGNGSGAAGLLTGGATGIGLSVVGGGTSGDGIKVVTTSGHGINLAPVGTSMHGLLATGGNGGTSDGIKAVNGTGGVGIRASDVTVTAVTTLTGAVSLGSTLSVAGTTTLAALNTGAIGTGNVTVTGTLSTSGTATFNALTITNAFTVSGATTLTGAVTATNAGNGITGVTASLTGDFTATMKTSAQTAADAAVTANTLINAIAGYIDTEVASLVTSVGAIKTTTDKFVFTSANKVDTDAYVALTAAQSEPGQGAPAVNASLATKIAYLYKAWRNRSTQTASTYKLYGDDATTVDQKASFSDDGTTADRGEIATGP